jgi:cysteine desulfurase
MYYLDHCGSTPLAKEVKDSCFTFLNSETFGNPSAVHHEVGQKASVAVLQARETVAQAVGALSSQIVFTSGATEANNLILWGFALRYRLQGAHIIYGATEHKSVFDTALALSELEGVTISEAPVDTFGRLDLGALETQLKKTAGKPTLVAVMHMNNEIPARHPVEDVSRLCLAHGAFFHSDGVQGYVREKLDFSAGTYGSYVISTHKIYGPKGLGILILGSGPLSTRTLPPFHGGQQENGLRPGTINTLAIVSGATCLELHEKTRERRVKHMAECARVFVETLSKRSPSFKLTVPVCPEVPGLVNFYFTGVDAPTLLTSLKEVCINRGASCTGSGGEKFSHVPRALGLPIEIQANVLRASFGDGVTVEDSMKAAEIIASRTQ